MTTKTTIELPVETREKLRDERAPHESTYAETIERLLGNPEQPYLTEEDAQRIAQQTVNDMVLPRALE